MEVDPGIIRIGYDYDYKLQPTYKVAVAQWRIQDLFSVGTKIFVFAQSPFSNQSFSPGTDIVFHYKIWSALNLNIKIDSVKK